MSVSHFVVMRCFVMIAFIVRFVSFVMMMGSSLVMLSCMLMVVMF